MQSIAMTNQETMRQHNERSQALNEAARRVLQKLFGCWQHDLSRPFTYNGKTYRVCMKCGMSRDFNLITWETQGAFIRCR
jgi:hypothetical protein